MSLQILTPYQKARAIDALQSALKAIQATPAQTPCTACENFQGGMCLHWKSIVPEEHRGRGCAEFEEPIPF